MATARPQCSANQESPGFSHGECQLSSQPHDATVVCKDNCPCEAMGKEMAKKKLLKRYYNALMHCNWIVYNYHNEKLKTVSATFCKQLDSINAKLDDYIFALKGVQKR